MRSHSLRAGDLVEVKGAREILPTLDERGSMEGLPFMPEMVPFCGRRFTVDKLALKVCDASRDLGSHLVPGGVLLENLRCDGAAHDGCQADCRFFWKEAWLRRVHGGEAAAPPEDAAAAAALRDLAERGRRKTVEIGGGREEVHRCQATEVDQFSRRVRFFDPRAYLRELRSGNVGLLRFLRVTARAAVEEPLNRFGLLRPTPLAGSRIPNAPAEPPLGLREGDWVRIKTREEIGRTLTAQGKNRGLWFDREQLPYCGDGRRYRVKARVGRIIDERTGRMNVLKNDCLTLEGIVCTGDYVPGRFFCPRGHMPYWRECWLERAPEEPGAGGKTGAPPSS